MKNKRKKNLTLGDLIEAAYHVWGEARAGEMMRLAVKTRLAAFQGHEQSLISAGEGELHE
jgi:hypothetical protein